MKRKEAYHEAMLESIKNSEMWLKEARIIAKNGSKGHAQALSIFASEELGKAVMCWFVVKGVFPLNHWEVDFRGSNSMFRKHPLKIATSIAFDYALDDEVPEDTQEKVTDPWTGERIEFRKLLTKMGAVVTLARSAWMYVDIRQESKGRISVTSPLRGDPVLLERTFESHEESLKTFKEFLRMDDENPEMLKELFLNLKSHLRDNDEDYPQKPEWK